jgi:hypothetical protein
MANNLLVPNVYYTAQQYVDPVLFNTPQTALVDNKLIYPLLKDAGNYQVAVAKAEIPLDTIPLTKYNIPLKRYEVILRQGQIEASAYLRQLNASKNDFLWNCTPAGVVNVYTYNPLGSLQSAGSTDCSAFVPNGVSFFCVDDFRNAYFATSSIPSGLVNVIIIVNLTTNTLLTTVTASLIQGMDLDRQNRLYVADEEPTGSVVKVYNNQNSAAEVNLVLATQITTDYQGNPLTAIRTIAADQTLLVGYDINKFSIYNLTTFEAYTGFTNDNITSMGRGSALNSAGQGSFVVVDDGEVDDLFIGNKSPAVINNLYNLVTDTAFGSPSVILNGTWLPSAKFAITNTGYCFGIGDDNNCYAFPYSNATASPTGTPVLISNTATFNNVTCEASRAAVIASSTYPALYALNLDNLPNNNMIEYDSNFALNAVSPLSWDFQASSHKYIGIQQSNNNLYITSKPIYPKNFMYTSSVSPTTTAQCQRLYGMGGNTVNQTAPGTLLQTANQGGGTIGILDSYQDGTGNIVSLNISLGLPFISRTTINGSLLNSFNLNDANYTSICFTEPPGTTACMNENGNIEVYNTLNGTLFETINTGFDSSNPSVDPIATICGGRVIGGGSFIFVCYGTTLRTYQSGNGNTGWSQVFQSNSIIPTGSSVPNRLYNGTFFGAGYAGSPTLYVVCSGSNATPGRNTSQAVAQLNFNSTYTTLTSSTLIQDNKLFTLINGSLNWNYNCNELYMLNGTLSTNEVKFTGNISAWNVTSDSITGTIIVDDPNNGLLASPCFYVSCGGNSGYYGWLPISATGASNFISVAVSRNNPNNLYVLDNTGTTYKGTLNGTNIAFSQYTAIDVNADWASISLAPDASAYDSYVYEYTISSQTQVGTTAHYPGKLIRSVARNDVAQNYSLSVQNTSIDFYNATTFENTGSAALNNANLIFTKAGEDVDAGTADIYNFQVFVDALNAAFAEAFARLNNGSLAEAPVASINFDNQLFTLNYSSDYAQQGNGIIFNPALLRIVQYYAVPDTIDVGFLKLVLPPNSTSLVQTNKSAYRFNKLNKILFQSTTIYVSGSFVGINAQNQTITDVDIPTDSFIDNLGQTLYFQPNLLRPYVLSSNNPIDRVQISILYSYIDGSEYSLTIAPDDGWSVLFDFIRKA